MNTLSFSRSFLGNAPLQEYLQKVLFSGNIQHAFLFGGPEHIGKTTLANSFFQGIACRDEHRRRGEALTSLPCLHCSTCLLFESHAYPDIFFFSSDTPYTPFSAEQARLVSGRLTKTSFSGGPKGVFLDLSSGITEEASNALLKIFEEPPQKSFIFIVCSRPYMLPATLRSRFQQLFFSLVPTNILYESALKRVQDRNQALMLARESLGRPGLLFHYLELDNDRDPHRFLETWLGLFEANDFHGRLSYVDVILGKSPETQRERLRTFLDIGTLLLRDLFFCRYGREQFVIFSRFLSRLQTLAQDRRNWLAFQKRMFEAHRDVQLYLSPKNIFEHLILSL